jgi:hypothetical protein
MRLARTAGLLYLAVAGFGGFAFRFVLIEPIEAAANSAYITLFDTGAMFLGVTNPSK